MTSGLNSVVRALTGPRRLRSALRQKTAAINRLLVALDGPGELRMRIPPAVFGGDIFGIISQQLRDALIAPPATAPVISRTHRKHSLPSSSNPLAKHSEDFLRLADWLKQSTLPSATFESISNKTLSANQKTTPHNTGASSLGPQASRLLTIESSPGRFLAGETPAVPVKSTTEIAASSTTKQLPATPALINILRRYWESNAERRDASRMQQQPLAPASLPNAADFHIAEPDQQTPRRTWPSAVAHDVSAKLRSFTDASNLSLKSTRLSSAPDRHVQNVFNIEVNHANQHASNFEDLGDRIAQILHEQALQHGIDVT